jgi:hypothetical protein
MITPPLWAILATVLVQEIDDLFSCQSTGSLVMKATATWGA